MPRYEIIIDDKVEGTYKPPDRVRIVGLMLTLDGKQKIIDSDRTVMELKTKLLAVDVPGEGFTHAQLGELRAKIKEILRKESTSVEIKLVEDDKPKRDR